MSVVIPCAPACGLGCLRLQAGEPGAQLIGLGEMQRLTDGQGLLPGRLGMLRSVGCPQDVTEIPKRFGLAMAVVQLAAEGEAFLQAGKGVAPLQGLPDLGSCRSGGMGGDPPARVQLGGSDGPRARGH